MEVFDLYYDYYLLILKNQSIYSDCLDLFEFAFIV